jgi:hypothetical protein
VDSYQKRVATIVTALRFWTRNRLGWLRTGCWGAPAREEVQQLRRNFHYREIYFTSMVVYLTTLSLQRLFTVDRMKIEEWELAGETVVLCPPRNQHKLAWNQTSLGVSSLLLFIRYWCVHELQIIVGKSKEKHPVGSGRCNSLTHSWSWALLEKLPIVQLLENFPAFYGTRRFITAFT